MSDVIRMNVMQSLHAKIRQGHLLSARETSEDLGIEVAGRIDWGPARPDDVTRLEHGGRKALSARLIQQIVLNCGFLNPVLAKGTARGFFGGRNLDTVSQDPDRPTMQKVLHLPLENLNEFLCAWERKADQVDYDVGFQLEDSLTENACCVLSLPVCADLLHYTPGRMGLIWFSLGTRNIDHFVSRRDETGDKVCSDVSGSSNNDDAHALSLRGRRNLSTLKNQP